MVEVVRVKDGIVLAVDSYYAVRLLRGEKDRELRKSLPKDFVGWVYIFVTKRSEPLYRLDNGDWLLASEYIDTPSRYSGGEVLISFPYGGLTYNGLIVGRFFMDGYDLLSFKVHRDHGWQYFLCKDGKFYFVEHSSYLDRLCLTYDQVLDYGLDPKGTSRVDLYAWHVRDVESFDIPYDLSYFGIKPPVMSWKYIYRSVEYRF